MSNISDDYDNVGNYNYNYNYDYSIHDCSIYFRDAGSKVFVHCKMGVSRSASTVIAHAMKDYGWTVEQGLKYVKEKRSCIRPNKGFMQQLELYQGILDARYWSNYHVEK